MGEKLDDSQRSSNDEKDIDDSAGTALAAANANALDASSSGQEEAGPSDADRRILAAHHTRKQDGVLVRLLKVVFYIPLKVLSIFGFNVWQNNVHVSGVDKIDKSPLRPPSTSPQKRKRDERDVSSDEIGEDETAKLLKNIEDDYDSEEDKDFKPEEESSCSDEYTEGDTEGELSKLSVEDVSEPRPSAFRNLTVVDDQPVKESLDENTNVSKAEGKAAVTVPATKCIDEPIAKPDTAPATIGVMG